MTCTPGTILSPGIFLYSTFRPPAGVEQHYSTVTFLRLDFYPDIALQPFRTAISCLEPSNLDCQGTKHFPDYGGPGVMPDFYSQLAGC